VSSRDEASRKTKMLAPWVAKVSGDVPLASERRLEHPQVLHAADGRPFDPNGLQPLQRVFGTRRSANLS
jgi:hypothetical protein